MSGNKKALPGMGTPPSSPIPSSSNPAGLGTPPSSPVASSSNPAVPTGQQPGATSVSVSMPSMQTPAVPTGQHSASTSLSVSLPGMQIPARPRLRPVQDDELNSPSPLSLTPHLQSVSRNNTSIHPQPMAGNPATGDSPMLRFPPPTISLPGMSMENTHNQGQHGPPIAMPGHQNQFPSGLPVQYPHTQGQPAVRPSIPGLTYIQGQRPWSRQNQFPSGLPVQHPHIQGQHAARPSIPGLTYIQGSASASTMSASSTQPPHGADSVHAPSFGAPFVYHGLPSPPTYAQQNMNNQPPAPQDSVPHWRLSDNDPVGSVTSAGMPQPVAHHFAAPPWESMNDNSVGGFTSAGMSQPAAHQFPAPPWRRANAPSVAGFPSAGIQQPTAPHSSLPPWRRQQSMPGFFPARQQLRNANLHHPRPIRPIRFAGVSQPEDCVPAPRKRTYRSRSRSNSRPARGKNVSKESAGPRTAPRPKRARCTAPRSDATTVAPAPSEPTSLPTANADATNQEQVSPEVAQRHGEDSNNSAPSHEPAAPAEDAAADKEI